MVFFAVIDPHLGGGGTSLHFSPPDGPLTHFASPRGETCRLASAIHFGINSSGAAALCFNEVGFWAA